MKHPTLNEYPQKMRTIRLKFRIIWCIYMDVDKWQKKKKANLKHTQLPLIQRNRKKNASD